ncbi:MAG TPA: DUF3047 domain-containing protein [Usitatibacteraceae bacterium]|nr:DUF3047 domain-containing protein [Usitatibacteraceae bacterium]
MIRLVTAIAALLLAACVAPVPAPVSTSRLLAGVQAFSEAPVGDPAPMGWEPWVLSRFLARTDYKIIETDGQRVLFANANTSASGLLQPLMVMPSEYPWLSWRWKVPQLIAGADNASRHGDDAPVRVIVAFDGDKSKWDFEDASFAGLVKLFSGREMPYATIQYIWENRLPPETVLDNAKTSRSKMLVVESGMRHLGAWREYRRDLRLDYERLFGEPPGPIIFVGLMTDTNATGAMAQAFYGDIRLSAAQP